MCECMQCMTINLMDTILSIILIIMNGIYAIWGIMLPHSKAKDVWKEYIDKLELYVNMVSYSDAVMLPLKIVSMILVKWCCCKCEKMVKEKSDDDCCNNHSINHGNNYSNNHGIKRGASGTFTYTVKNSNKDAFKMDI